MTSFQGSREHGAQDRRLSYPVGSHDADALAGHHYQIEWCVQCRHPGRGGDFEPSKLENGLSLMMRGDRGELDFARPLGRGRPLGFEREGTLNTRLLLGGPRLWTSRHPLAFSPQCILPIAVHTLLVREKLRLLL